VKINFCGPVVVALLGAAVSGCTSSPTETLEVSLPASPIAPDPVAHTGPGIAEVQLIVEATSLRVGDTARVVARAVGADGETIDGVEFRIRTPRRILGVIEDGAAVVAIREGPAIVTAEALVEAVPVPGLARGSTELIVLPAPLDRIDIAVAAQVYEGARTTAIASAYTAYGPRETAPLMTWHSTDASVLRVSPNGRVQAVGQGSARLEVRSEGVGSSRSITVVPNPVRRLSVSPRESDVRVGDVVHISAAALDGSRSGVGDAEIEWSASEVNNDPSASALVESDGTFVANSPGLYRVTATFGELAAVVEVRARSRSPREQVRAVANRPVPTGAGATTDLWVFEGVDGRDYAYTGTLAAATLYTWDVTDAADPVLTDSLKLDGRRVNDVKINGNATIAVVTSEGASNRRNGFTLFDILDPAHPKVITHFTENLTGGVHNVWIEGNLVYAVHNGTQDLHIIDISDPSSPRHAGRWGVDSEGRSLHDVMIQDGLAYLSYWNDGLVILDVGAGISGGTPTEPRLVSQFVYSTRFGAESYGNTHHAIRYRNWVFVADEIFGCAECINGPRGYVRVIDVTDIANPREIASYRVPEAGAHNMWVEDDRLYVAYYQAGVRVVDIAGELRGDLYGQGREIGWFMTESPTSDPPNATMSWGPQPFKGSLFVSDLNSGLWILELESERREPVP
jgi:hypothetical protein